MLQVRRAGDMTSSDNFPTWAWILNIAIQEKKQKEERTKWGSRKGAEWGSESSLDVERTDDNLAQLTPKKVKALSQP